MTMDSTPVETIRVFARSIHTEAVNYGFSQLDIVRLINELMDISATEKEKTASSLVFDQSQESLNVDSEILRSERLEIRHAIVESDCQILEQWLSDEYGKHFLLSCSAAEMTSIEHILSQSQNQLGIVLRNGSPIGAVAFLDIDRSQRRAELRKLIGSRDARGKGFAEEATRLWIQYGYTHLGLRKIYVSTLQTHLRNIQLNESIGFRVEGLLQKEVVIDNRRYDVLRMGLCLDE